MKKYVNSKIEIISLEIKDVIASSIITGAFDGDIDLVSELSMQESYEIV